jgi:hypothetical protein
MPLMGNKLLIFMKDYRIKKRKDTGNEDKSVIIPGSRRPFKKRQRDSLI